MVTFSTEIRAVIGAEVHFDEIEERYARCLDLKTPKVRRADGTMMGRIPLKVAVLLRIGLRRVLELTESFARDVNAGRFAPSIESAEALLEAASLLKGLQLRVEKVVKDKDMKVINEFDDQAVKDLGGSKSDWGHSERYKAMNMLAIIDRTRPEQMRTAVCGVGLGLLLAITAAERYNAIETEFVRLCDVDFRTGGGA
jgi:hypothetical protein